MIEVHLYGKLRRFTDNQDPTRDSIIHVSVDKTDTIEDVIKTTTLDIGVVGRYCAIKQGYITLIIGQPSTIIRFILIKCCLNQGEIAVMII